MEKVYCKNCKYRGWGNSWQWCESPILDTESGSKFTSKFIKKDVVKKIELNNSGKCGHYKKIEWWRRDL